MQNTAPPDPRWKTVEGVLRRRGQSPHALIEVLHAVQQAFGYLDVSALRYLAEALGVPLSRVYGVSTFYHLFTLNPPSEHVCMVCTGTSCHLKGAPAILAALKTLDLQPGGVRRGLSLQITRCVGTCALAPLAELDDAVLARSSPEEVVKRVQEVWS